MIACGYRWNDGVPYMAPGHNSVLHNADDEWFLVYHIREHNFRTTSEPSTMQIRKLFWTPDGWPVASAEPYSGEKSQPIPEEYLLGHYERIQLTPALPQGIQCSVPMKLEKDHYYECCSIQGSWSADSNQTVTITYGNHREHLVASVAWDQELDQETIILTGKTDHGIAVWAKKVSAS